MYIHFAVIKYIPMGGARELTQKLCPAMMLLTGLMKINSLYPEKSSCVFCPFQSDQNWIRLKTIAPEDFKAAVEVDKQIRDSSIKGIKSPIYLHDSLLPLDEVDFNENQGNLWGNCTDGCDV